MPRLITENQYRELCRYESGMPTWVDGGPLVSLVTHGYVEPTGWDSNMFRITVAGAAALAAVRAHWGIAAPTTN